MLEVAVIYITTYHQITQISDKLSSHVTA